MLYTNLSSYPRPTLPHTAPDQPQQPASTAFPLNFYQNNENFAPNASFGSSQHQQFSFSAPNPYSLSDLYMPGIAASSNYAFGNPETNRFLPVGPTGNFSSAFNPASYQSISSASGEHMENEEDKENVPLKSKVPVNSPPFESGLAQLPSKFAENCSGNLRPLERNSLENKTGPNMAAGIAEDESAPQPLASGQFNSVPQFNSALEERRYRERRQRNNEAAKQSRSKRRERENILRERVEALEAENKRLRQQLVETQKKLAKESCMLKLSDRNNIQA